jgi:lysophospholipase L1-like esterase
MSEDAPKRLMALGLGTLLAGALCWGIWKVRADIAAQSDLARRTRLRKWVGERSSRTESGSSPADTRSPEARRYFVSEEDALSLFARDQSAEIYDPWCYHRHVGNASLTARWEEHPKGEWHWVTNSLGLRENHELSANKPDLRILVAGDSHTDGFCDNEESYPNLVERLLGNTRRGQHVEVINAGNGGFSFYHYLGTLERFLHLEPDVFVLAVYCGNDFYELGLPRAYFQQEAPVAWDEALDEAVGQADALDNSAVVQAFLSLIWFRRHPQTIEGALETAVELVQEMRARCERAHIRFLCLLIPSAVDVSWGAHEDAFGPIAWELGMLEEDLRINDRLAQAFLERLAELGCEILDPRPQMRESATSYYWKKDYHLNVRGHALLGRLLAERIESWGDWRKP